MHKNRGVTSWARVQLLTWLSSAGPVSCILAASYFQNAIELYSCLLH